MGYRGYGTKALVLTTRRRERDDPTEWASAED
jgi:hypothetical protein